MRIIGGKLKGKKIFEPKNKITRPLKDLTKESIFNIIIHSNKFNVDLKNSNVLDLFAGVGSFGLECLSRGSIFITFVENYPEVLKVLKRNISNLRYQSNSIIIKNDINNDLNFKLFKQKFDIIFLDPPYKEKSISQLLKKIIDAKILNQKGLLIMHRHKKGKDVIPKELKIIENKTYGISRIVFTSFD